MLADLALNTQQLFNAVEPWRVAQDAGFRLSRGGLVYTAQDPNDPNKVFHLDKFSIIQQGGTDFFAGGPLDFLAYRMGWDYRLATEDYYSRYESLLVRRISGPYTDMKEQMALEAETRRAQFLKILSWRGGLDEPGMTPVLQWMDSRGLETNLLRLTMYGVKGIQLNELLANDLFIADRPYIVFPILSDPYTFCGLDVHDPVTNRGNVVALRPAKHGYYGLHSLTDKNLTQGTVIYPKTKEAAEFQCWCIRNGYYVGVVAGYFFDKAARNPYQLVEANVIKPQGYNVEGLLRQLQLAEKVNIIENSNSPKISLEDYLFKQVVELAGKEVPGEPLSRGFHTFVGQIHQHHSDLYDAVEKTLATTLTPEQLAELRDAFGTGTNFTCANLPVRETPTGYQAFKPGMPGVHVTNFTLKMNRLLYFPDHPKDFLLGEVVMSGHRWPIALETDLKTGLAIEAVVRSSANSQLPPNFKGRPSLTDTTHGKILVSIVRQLAAKVPGVQGVYRLGWDAGRTQFSAPAWRADSYGVKTGPQLPFPFSELFRKYYSFTPAQDTTPISEVVPREVALGMWELLTVMASWLVRAYHDLETPPIQVLQTPESLNLLKAVFYPLGQMRPIQLNPNIRQETVKVEPEIAGVPSYATCVADRVFGYLRAPVFYLVKEGDDAVKCPSLTELQLRQISCVATKVLHELVFGVLCDSDVKFADLPEAGVRVRLLQEGRQLIQRYTNFKDVQIFTDDYPEFYKLLGTLKDQRARDSVFYRSRTHDCGVIRIKSTEDGVKPREIIARELQQLDPDIEIVGDGIRIDLNVLQKLLENFYGKIEIRDSRGEFKVLPENAVRLPKLEERVAK